MAEKRMLLGLSWECQRMVVDQELSWNIHTSHIHPLQIAGTTQDGVPKRHWVEPSASEAPVLDVLAPDEPAPLTKR